MRSERDIFFSFQGTVERESTSDEITNCKSVADWNGLGLYPKATRLYQFSSPSCFYFFFFLTWRKACGLSCSPHVSVVVIWCCAGQIWHLCQWDMSLQTSCTGNVYSEGWPHSCQAERTFTWVVKNCLQLSNFTVTKRLFIIWTGDGSTLPRSRGISISNTRWKWSAHVPKVCLDLTSWSELWVIGKCF